MCVMIKDQKNSPSSKKRKKITVKSQKKEKKKRKKIIFELKIRIARGQKKEKINENIFSLM